MSGGQHGGGVDRRPRRALAVRAFVAMVLAAALLAGATAHPSFADADVGGDGPPFFGSAAGLALHAPVVGIAAAPSGSGYWLAAADGGVFGYGDAPFLGSMADTRLVRPVVGLAATPSGRGYWLAAADGGVFGFGDARFFGSASRLALHAPIVGMAVTPSGDGYWLVAADGGVFAFGDAPFLGSTGGLPLNDTVVGMAPTAEGRGYVLVARDGGVFAFGDARYFPGSSAGRPIVAASANGIGVLLVRADGSTLEGIGEAVVAGSGVAGSALDGRIVAAAAAPPLGSENVWLVTPAGEVIGVGGGPYVLTR